MTSIREEQRVLLALLGQTLFGRAPALEQEPDWNAVLREAKQQAVLPLAWEAAKTRLSGPKAEAMDEAVGKLVANNMFMDFDHVELHQAMTAAGIGYVVMKGSASAAYYPQPMLRMMGDVDFLVRQEDAARAGQTLGELGFRETEERDNPIHQAYVRDTDPTHRSEWELHWQPNGIPRNAAGEEIRALLADSVETARLRETENGAYMVPDDFHHGLMILIHTAMHMIHSGVGLRHLCDWAVFAESLSDERFCALFREPLERTGLWDFACVLTALSTRYLGGAERPWTGERSEELLEGLMCDILSGGNFGKKDRARLDEARLLVDREKGLVSGEVSAKNLLSALNVKARRAMPFLQKAPLLLPLGWGYVALRHLGRMARGSRPALRLDRAVAGAEQRSRLYRQLRLFEQEQDG